MNTASNNKTAERISIMYFAVALVLLISELMHFYPFLHFFGPLRSLILMALYFFSSKKRSKVYFGVLLFAFFSDFLFIDKTQELLVYGVLAYMIYRVLTIVLVFKTIKGKKILPIAIATLPFLFAYFYVIDFTKEVISVNFYPLAISGLLMSFLGGLSLSNYILDNDNKNSWLLISSLLFVLQNFIFILQRYYAMNGVFEPLATIVFSISHYTFYKYVITDEK
jgi:hypothetical protein